MKAGYKTRHYDWEEWTLCLINNLHGKNEVEFIYGDQVVLKVSVNTVAVARMKPLKQLLKNKKNKKV